MIVAVVEAPVAGIAPRRGQELVIALAKKNDSDGDDDHAGDHAGPEINLTLTDHPLEIERDEPQQDHAPRVGYRDHDAKNDGVPRGALLADEIGRHYGFPMARRKGMAHAQGGGDGQPECEE